MNITVKVSFDVAISLQSRDPQRDESKELLRLLESLGVALEPMHAGTKDPNLICYFLVEVVDNEIALHVAESLNRSGLVEGAYIKPADEPPK